MFFTRAENFLRDISFINIILIMKQNTKQKN